MHVTMNMQGTSYLLAITSALQITGADVYTCNAVLTLSAPTRMAYILGDKLHHLHSCMCGCITQAMRLRAAVVPPLPASHPPAPKLCAAPANSLSTSTPALSL